MKVFDITGVVLHLLEEKGLREHLSHRKRDYPKDSFDRKDGKGRRIFVLRVMEWGVWTCYGQRLIIGDPKFFEQFDAFCDRIFTEF